MEIKSEINNDIETADKKKKSKERESLFLITINTNKSLNCSSEEVVKKIPEIEERFRALLHSLFSQENLPKILIDIGRPGTYEKKPINSETVKSIKAKTNIEANRDMCGFLHSHTFISVVHKTRVQINSHLVKSIVYKILEPVLTFDGKFKKPYVNIRGVDSKKFAINQYVSGSKEN